jgi:subfamily B ATP-binding cassette protein MsbA
MSFFSLIKPYRRGIFLTLVCIFLANILALFLPWGIKTIIDDVLREGNVPLLRAILLGLFGILVLRTGLNFFQKYTSSIIGERIVGDIRRELYWQVQRLSLAGIRTIAPSQILTRITGDVDSIRRFLFGDALDFIYSVFGVAGIVALLVWLNVRLTVVALLTLPFFIVIYIGMVPRLKDRYGRLRDAYGRMTSRVNEVLGGILTVRAFGGERHEKSRFDASQEAIFKIARRTHATNIALWMGAEFFTSAGVLGVLWLGGEDVVAGRMTAGSLIAFYSYLGMLFAPVLRMVNINNSYQEAAAALKRIDEIFTIKDDIPAAVSPVALPSLRGAVEFEAVSYRYSPHRRALDKLTFAVKPGETVGIVGPNGAGKSTLVGLLLRFFDPEEGRILIDGHDLRDLDLGEYRRRVSVVLQEDFLFQDTVADNIRYGRTDVPLPAVVAAARLAQAHDFIEALPNGYDTLVGERGALLSCGQRQRIAIARALVREPSILILDEATSAMDAMTENRIQQVIKGQGKDRTVFIVAHRFSTIMEVDKIIVLEGGRLVASGRHEELLGRSVFYRQLYQEQFKGSNEASAIAP